MQLLEGQTRQRVRRLSTKLASSPVLPVLGYTKTVESFVVGGPTPKWLAYSLLVTLVWVFADDLRRRADDLADGVQDAVDDATNSEN